MIVMVPIHRPAAVLHHCLKDTGCHNT